MNEEEAKKALNTLKGEIKSEISEEMKTVISESAGVISKEVMSKVESEMKDLKASSKSEDEAEKEAGMVKAFKALYRKDIYGEVNKDLDSATATAGEELVPEYFGNEVIRVASKVGVARQNSRVITLPGKIFNLPGFGNVTAYRTDEAGAYTASGLTTSQLTFTAKKLTAMVIATKEVIEDANVDIIRWIAELAGEGIARKEDEWAFLGLASGEGIFQHADVPEYTMEATSDAYTDLTFDHLIGALALVDDNAVDNLVWVGSFSVFNSLRSAKSTTGEYIYQNPGAGMPNTIWGLPFVKSTVMPKTTDASQADKPFFAGYDPKYLMIGDRKTIEVEFSKEATVTSSDGSTPINLFEQDMVAIKVSERLDIQLAEPTKAFVRILTNAS